MLRCHPSSWAQKTFLHSGSSAMNFVCNDFYAKKNNVIYIQCYLYTIFKKNNAHFRHTGKFLADQIKAMITAEMGSMEKIFGIITDNARNMRNIWAQYETLGIFGWGCAAHVLHLLSMDICVTLNAQTLINEVTEVAKTVRYNVTVKIDF